MMPDIGVEPRSLPDVRRELRRVASESAEYWGQYSSADFFAPLAADAWSPADHVRHLTKSIRPVTDALRLPRFVIRILFGSSPRPSRSFTQLRADYLAGLAGGGTAGRFAPRPLPDSERTAASRERVMRFHDQAVEKLEAAVTRWDEHVADTLRLPHPLMGKLTVREMLFFTLYHNLHHVHVVERRIRERSPAL